MIGEFLCGLQDLNGRRWGSGWRPLNCRIHTLAGMSFLECKHMLCPTLPNSHFKFSSDKASHLPAQTFNSCIFPCVWFSLNYEHRHALFWDGLSKACSVVLSFIRMALLKRPTLAFQCSFVDATSRILLIFSKSWSVCYFRNVSAAKCAVLCRARPPDNATISLCSPACAKRSNNRLSIVITVRRQRMSTGDASKVRTTQHVSAAVVSDPMSVCLSICCPVSLYCGNLLRTGSTIKQTHHFQPLSVCCTCRYPHCILIISHLT